MSHLKKVKRAIRSGAVVTVSEHVLCDPGFEPG